jgi:aerobic-type carbon monoxide dehydrogenase small subunit (CoxS/CutS family)
MLAVEARGRDVRTAESLAGGRLDPVPAAFADCDAQQCGFCTPGFVVAMRAVFDKNPNATPAEVEKGLEGNICRCGTYEQMRQTITQLCRKGG